MVQNFEVYRL